MPQIWVAATNENKCMLFKQFTAYHALWGTLNQIFYFNLRRDHRKISNECHDYESVDEKNLS